MFFLLKDWIPHLLSRLLILLALQWPLKLFLCFLLKEAFYILLKLFLCVFDKFLHSFIHLLHLQVLLGNQSVQIFEESTFLRIHPSVSNDLLDPLVYLVFIIPDLLALQCFNKSLSDESVDSLMSQLSKVAEFLSHLIEALLLVFLDGSYSINKVRLLNEFSILDVLSSLLIVCLNIKVFEFLRSWFSIGGE